MPGMEWPPQVIDRARQELLDVLRETREMLARPENDFLWSSWQDADAALSEMDTVISSVKSGRLADRFWVSVLFAPTGPIQETAIRSGWGDEFLALASRCDGALAILHRTG